MENGRSDQPDAPDKETKLTETGNPEAPAPEASETPPSIDEVFPEDTDAGEEKRGSGPRQQHVSSVFTEMARVARSFLLYDPRNEAIRHFLQSLLDNLLDCLKEGPIQLKVQPFELWYEGEVVYLNRDREKSLAFRFYRDGVRGLHFLPGFDWEELAKLLEILSIRYTACINRKMTL